MMLHIKIKTAFLFFVGFLLLLGCISCSKDYDTGLRAKWQLKERVTDGISERKDSIFYNFDNYIFCFQKVYANGIDRFETYAEFTQRGDSLFIEIKDDRYAEPWMLQRMEWKSRKKEFQIQELSGSRLVLSDSLSYYYFRKF